MTSNNNNRYGSLSLSSSFLVSTIGTYCISGAAIFIIGLWTGRILADRTKLLIKDETDEQLVEQEQQNELPAPRRFGSVIQLKPDQYRRYRELHDNVWPEIIQRMYESNIRNFVIYYHAQTNTLYQHYEWIGHHIRYQQQKKEIKQQKEQEEQSEPPKAMEADAVVTNNNNNNNIKLLPRTISTVQNIEIEWYNNDMEQILNDPITRIWWKECEPCQIPFTVNWEQQVLPSDGGTIQWWTPLECVCHINTWPTSYSKPWNKMDPDFVKLE